MVMPDLNVTAAPPFEIVPGAGAPHEAVTGDGKRLVYIRGFRHVFQGFQRQQTVTDYITIHGRFIDWAEAYPVGYSLRYTNSDNHVRTLRIDSLVENFDNRTPEFGGEYHANIQVQSTYDMEDDDANPFEAAIAVMIVALTREP